jgi:hypothetical protein
MSEPALLIVAFPAKAGTHRSTDWGASGWVPASAENAVYKSETTGLLPEGEPR